MKLDIRLPDQSMHIEIEIDKDRIVWESTMNLSVYVAAGVAAKIANMFPGYAVKSFTYDNNSTSASIKAVLKNYTIENGTVSY